MKNYFDQLYFNPNNVTDLMKLAAYTEQEPKEGYPDKDIGTWKSMFNESLTLDSDDYRRARAEDAWLGSSGTLLGSMDKYDLDALVVPTVIAYGVAAIAGAPLKFPLLEKLGSLLYVGCLLSHAFILVGHQDILSSMSRWVFTPQVLQSLMTGQAY